MDFIYALLRRLAQIVSFQETSIVKHRRKASRLSGIGVDQDRRNSQTHRPFQFK